MTKHIEQARLDEALDQFKQATRNLSEVCSDWKADVVLNSGQGVRLDIGGNFVGVVVDDSSPDRCSIELQGLNCSLEGLQPGTYEVVPAREFVTVVLEVPAGTGRAIDSLLIDRLDEDTEISVAATAPGDLITPEPEPEYRWAITRPHQEHNGTVAYRTRLVIEGVPATATTADVLGWLDDRDSRLDYAQREDEWVASVQRTLPLAVHVHWTKEN